MKEFMLLFRYPANNSIPPEEWPAIEQKWKEWVAGLQAKGSFAAPGQRLAKEGKVLKPGGVITDGPFVEMREVLGGACVIKAEGLEDAATLAHGCPALNTGGSVEIRPIFGQ